MKRPGGPWRWAGLSPSPWQRPWSSLPATPGARGVRPWEGSEPGPAGTGAGLSTGSRHVPGEGGSAACPPPAPCRLLLRLPSAPQPPSSGPWEWRCERTSHDQGDVPGAGLEAGRVPGACPPSLLPSGENRSRGGGPSPQSSEVPLRAFACQLPFRSRPLPNTGHTHVYMYTSTHTCTHTCACTHTCMHAHTRTHTPAHKYTYTCTHMPAHTFTYTYMCTRACTRMCACF